MADVVMVMPKSISCRFEEAWQGKCKKPSTNGWCTKHEKMTCLVCGNHATRTCDYTGSNPFVCGTPLCENCKHEPYNKETAPFPSQHLKKKDYEKALAKSTT